MKNSIPMDSELAKAFKVGDHVGGKYRSTTWTGKITSILKRDKEGEPEEVAIKPDKDSKHPGEPSRIHRHTDKIHNVH